MRYKSLFQSSIALLVLVSICLAPFDSSKACPDEKEKTPKATGDTKSEKPVADGFAHRGAEGEKEKAVLFGIESFAKRTVFIADFSGSMTEDDRLSMLKEELDGSLEKLSPKTSYQVIYYSHRPWLGGENVGNAPFRDYEDPKDRISWMVADKKSIASTREQLKRMGNSGGTNWISPTRLALAMRPMPDQVWLISDGEASDRKEMIDELEKINEHKVPINTIAINITGPTAESLIEIADKSGGEFAIVYNKTLYNGEAARRIVKEKK